MRLDNLAQIDAAIVDAVARIGRQRLLIAECKTKGYDVSAPLKLLSCLRANLCALESRRREHIAGIDDVLAVDVSFAFSASA